MILLHDIYNRTPNRDQPPDEAALQVLLQLLNQDSPLRGTVQAKQASLVRAVVSIVLCTARGVQSSKGKIKEVPVAVDSPYKVVWGLGEDEKVGDMWAAFVPYTSSHRPALLEWQQATAGVLFRLTTAKPITVSQDRNKVQHWNFLEVRKAKETLLIDFNTSIFKRDSLVCQRALFTLHSQYLETACTWEHNDLQYHTLLGL